jgi:hypothetical protein
LANQDPIESATLRPFLLLLLCFVALAFIALPVAAQEDRGAKDGPRTHKASNVGPTPFHNISFIFNSPQPSGFTPGTRGAGYAQVMDNERARGWRLVLESGQSVPAITQAAPGIRIVVSGGELVESVSGQPDRAMSPKMGEFFWQDAGVTRAVRNTGTTRLELVEFEIR